MTSLRFKLNGRVVDVSGVDPNTTLLSWLRERGLTGTKEGCAEGECGACAVVLVRRGLDGEARYAPVNSCLFLMGSAADQEVITVEGVANGALHPVQEAMVRLGGSQCGYCTPGFVMSLFSEYYRADREVTGFDVESIAGNLCRCTGYRPIRDAGRGLPRVADTDAHAARLAAPAPEASSVRYEANDRAFFRPTDLAELFEVLGAHPRAKLVCGGTDLVVFVNQRHDRHETLVSLEAVREMHVYEDTEDALVIGGAVPLSEIEERLTRASTQEALPVLTELFPLFSSRLIRNRATLGGNLANASPIGDSAPALLALGAEVVLASASGERTIGVHELFTGYRKTALKAGEVIATVRIPKPFPTLNRFYKVSKRVHDDISTVAAGFALELDEDGVVVSARLAYGGVAATPVRAAAAEKALVGKKWSAKAARGARALLESAFQPMSDQRGSAEYRKAMVTRLFDKLCSETGATA
jgi:xanthine dehydrogenase small subunit